jgi:uncharacterized delta-60 repeat protein
MRGAQDKPSFFHRACPVALGFIVLAFPSAAQAQAGELDGTFSGDGRVATNFTTELDLAAGIAVQPGDGKIVIAGYAGGGARFALARYDGTGALDSAFSGDGRVTTDFTSGPDAGFEVVLQTDGKIVVVGRAARQGGRFALARYNADGTLDTSFGGDGRVTTNFTSGDDFAFGVAIQSDGKIVATGRAGGSGGRIALARYNADGALDPSFGGTGKVTTNFTSGDDRADMLAIQADGRIVAAGTANYFGAGRFAVVRYNADGSLDTSFSGDGKVTTNVSSRWDGAFGVAIQISDQKIVVTGEAGPTVGLVRYNPDGTLDMSFSGDGTVTTNFTAGLDYADDLKIQGDGKIVVAGSANFFGRDAKFALARYNADGALDTSFSGDGKVTTNFTRGRDQAFNVAIQPGDGKIVAAGTAAGGGGRFAVARYTAA